MAGNTVLLQPTLGHRLRALKLSYSPDKKNECAWRFGLAGGRFWWHQIGVNTVSEFTANVEDSTEGQIGEPLVFWQANSGRTLWNALIAEV